MRGLLISFGPWRRIVVEDRPTWERYIGVTCSSCLLLTTLHQCVDESDRWVGDLEGVTTREAIARVDGEAVSRMQHVVADHSARCRRSYEDISLAPVRELPRDAEVTICGESVDDSPSLICADCRRPIVEATVEEHAHCRVPPWPKDGKR